MPGSQSRGGEVAARHPDLIVLAATRAQALEPLTAQLAALARAVPLLLAGAGATARLAAAVGARQVASDPVTAASVIGTTLFTPGLELGTASTLLRF